MRHVGWLLLILGCIATTPTRPVTAPATPISTEGLCAALPTGLHLVRVDPIAGDDSASGECASPAACTPWKTLAHAGASAKPGDLVELVAGTYAEDAAILVSGTATQPIVFSSVEGAEVILQKSVVLAGNSHLQFRGLRFESPSNDIWFGADKDTHDLTLIGNTFNSSSDKRDQSFSGLKFEGRTTVLCGNSFGSWLGDMVTAEGVDGFLLENNDFSQSTAMHSLVAVVGRHVVIRGNAFRNPWHRVLHITDRSAESPSEDVLVENNTFIDSDWVTGRALPSNEQQFQGGAEVVRFMGARGIFRNNLLVGNHEGNNWECRGVLNFQTFVNAGSGFDVRRYTKFRVYNNVFEANKSSSIIFYQGPAADPGNLDDNKFKNNIITKAQKFSIATCNKGVPWQTYRFEGNLVPGQQVRFTEVGELPVTLKDMQVSFFTSFVGNLGDSPSYVYDGFAGTVTADPASYRLKNLREAFEAYRLTATSAGKDKAAALAKATIDVSESTALHVDDAHWFSAGYGLVAGDVIRVGTSTARITAIDVADGLLTLDGPVTAKAGDPVTLDGLKDIGVR